MKFSEGYWVKKAGYVVEHPRVIQDVERTSETCLTVFAPTRHVRAAGDELDSPMLTTTIEGIADGVIRVRQENYRGARVSTPVFGLTELPAGEISVEPNGEQPCVRAGSLTAVVQNTGS